MNARRSFVFVCALICASIFSTSSKASVIVNYTGAGDAIGLSAEAEFELFDFGAGGGFGSGLRIRVTSLSALNVNIREDSDHVLSSINFDLPTSNDIQGGSVALNLGSNVVTRDKPGSTWKTSSYSGDLNDEYGYSNTGVGNDSGDVVILSGISGNKVDELVTSAITSHSNGGTRVTTFNGDEGGVDGGLDFGLVAHNTVAFGDKDFILDSIILELEIDAPLSDLSFLEKGSYVEYGSDFAYIGDDDGNSDDGGDNQVPEPATVLVWSVLGACFGAGAYQRRRRKASQAS